MLNYTKNKRNPDLIFGIRSVLEAIDSGKEINKVLIKSGTEGALLIELKKKLAEKKIVYQYVPEEKINRLAFNKNHQGVIALISPVEYTPLEELIPSLFEKGVSPLIIALDGITDVRNFGAIARSALALGAHGLLIPEQTGVSVTSDAIKTSAGALFHIPTCRTRNLSASLEFLRLSGLQIIACTEKAEKKVGQINFQAPTVLVFGCEESGISPACLKKAHEQVKISINPDGVSSLNVSTAVAIFLYAVQQSRNL